MMFKKWLFLLKVLINYTTQSLDDYLNPGFLLYYSNVLVSVLNCQSSGTKNIHNPSMLTNLRICGCKDFLTKIVRVTLVHTILLPILDNANVRRFYLNCDIMD